MNPREKVPTEQIIWALFTADRGAVKTYIFYKYRLAPSAYRYVISTTWLDSQPRASRVPTTGTSACMLHGKLGLECFKSACVALRQSFWKLKKTLQDSHFELFTLPLAFHLPSRKLLPLENMVSFWSDCFWTLLFSQWFYHLLLLTFENDETTHQDLWG